TVMFRMHVRPENEKHFILQRYRQPTHLETAPKGFRNALVMERSTVQSCLAAPFFADRRPGFTRRFLIHRTRNQSPRYPLTARVHHRPRGTIMGTEVELKLATSRSELRKAMALPWLTKMAAEPAKHQHLTSVYFDTPDLV